MGRDGVFIFGAGYFLNILFAVKDKGLAAFRTTLRKLSAAPMIANNK